MIYLTPQSQTFDAAWLAVAPNTHVLRTANGHVLRHSDAGVTSMCFVPSPPPLAEQSQRGQPTYPEDKIKNMIFTAMPDPGRWTTTRDIQRKMRIFSSTTVMATLEKLMQEKTVRRMGEPTRNGRITYLYTRNEQPAFAHNLHSR